MSGEKNKKFMPGTLSINALRNTFAFFLFIHSV